MRHIPRSGFGAGYPGRCNVSIWIRTEITNSRNDEGGCELSRVKRTVSDCRKVYLGTLPASCVTLLRSPRPNSSGASHSHVMSPVRQPRPNKSCGCPQGSGTRDEARVHVNPEKFPHWVGYSTLTGCGCTSSFSAQRDVLRIYVRWETLRRASSSLNTGTRPFTCLGLLSRIYTKFEHRAQLPQNSSCTYKMDP